MAKKVYFFYRPIEFDGEKMVFVKDGSTGSKRKELRFALVEGLREASDELIFMANDPDCFQVDIQVDDGYVFAIAFFYNDGTIAECYPEEMKCNGKEVRK